MTDEWLAMEQMLSTNGADPTPAPKSTSATITRPVSFHTLVLRTFQGDDGTAARQWHKQLGTLVPPLQPKLAVHVDRKGSVVVFGVYEGWEDPQATIDMKTLRDVRVNDKKIFGAIVRTDVRPRRTKEQIHPQELIALRVRYPDARTIYTLEIGVWGDFDSGQLTPEVRRQRAESRVAALRSEGVPAFFHHDPTTELSTVTVGAFGEDALDPSSGLMSVEVERWQQQFPNRLTNGEKLNLPIQGQPQLDAVPQRSRLVLVPEW
ncbi:MAG: hypothetical protein P8I91_08980 [Phycisphaerales bacterium]|nr:hypothetical protein [Phycisphaerales bacterium]